MSDGRLPMEYDIRGVLDFLMVPEERRAICLGEFAEWLKQLEAIEQALGLALKGSPTVFRWIDDDKGEMRTVLHGSGLAVEITEQINREGA